MGLQRVDIFVIVPAYNESQAIQRPLTELVEAGYRVVVVDDGSTDETYAEALKHPVYVLRHPCNLGQGAALQTGITFALRNPDCQYVVTFDSDGQHQAADVERLLDALDSTGCDIALGSRFKEGLWAENIPRGKLLTLKLAVFLTRLTTGLKVTDTHNGLRAFTRSAAGQIQITQNRMSHASQILDQIADLELKTVEVPVSIHYTEYSVGKGQSLWNSINILWDSLIGRLK